METNEIVAHTYDRVSVCVQTDARTCVCISLHSESLGSTAIIQTVVEINAAQLFFLTSYSFPFETTRMLQVKRPPQVRTGWGEDLFFKESERRKNTFSVVTPSNSRSMRLERPKEKGHALLLSAPRNLSLSSTAKWSLPAVQFHSRRSKSFPFPSSFLCQASASSILVLPVSNLNKKRLNPQSMIKHKGRPSTPKFLDFEIVLFRTFSRGGDNSQTPQDELKPPAPSLHLNKFEFSTHFNFTSDANGIATNTEDPDTTQALSDCSKPPITPTALIRKVRNQAQIRVNSASFSIEYPTTNFNTKNEEPNREFLTRPKESARLRSESRTKRGE